MANAAARVWRAVIALGLAMSLGAGAAWGRRNRHPKVVPIDPASVEEPKANEVCFSPEEPCAAKLVKFVQGAQKSLDVAIYDINLDQLVHNLAVKAMKLPVRVVVDQRQSKGEHSLVALLVKAGVNVRFGRQRGIMHNKFIIRDGAAVETGSFNFTNHAATANNENQLYVDTPAVVARYAARFEQIWGEAEPVSGSPAKAQQAAPIGVKDEDIDQPRH